MLASNTVVNLRGDRVAPPRPELAGSAFWQRLSTENLPETAYAAVAEARAFLQGLPVIHARLSTEEYSNAIVLSTVGSSLIVGRLGADPSLSGAMLHTWNNDCVWSRYHVQEQAALRTALLYLVSAVPPPSAGVRTLNTSVGYALRQSTKNACASAITAHFS